MQYTTLGTTNLKISRLCLGCMTFGEPGRGNHAWTLPEESSRPIIKRALEGGINFFDTSNNYSDGSSEELIGRALRDFARREDIVVATKVYHQQEDDSDWRRLMADGERLLAQLEEGQIQKEQIVTCEYSGLATALHQLQHRNFISKLVVRVTPAV